MVETRLEDLSPTTVAAARDVVLDTIGAILGGSRLAENSSLARLAQTMSGAGHATVFGHQVGRVQPVFAALVNATAGVALELDEGSRLGGGHPSIHVTPGAVAVAEEVDATGKAALEAVIVGYEVTSRIGTGVQSKSVVHSHGTWGTIGAAAATARLLGYDAAATRQAMNLAMSMSPANTWTPCLEGGHHPQPVPRPLRVPGHYGRLPGTMRIYRRQRRPGGPVHLHPGRGASTRRRWWTAGVTPAPPGRCALSRTTPSTTPVASTTTPYWTRRMALQRREGFSADAVKRIDVTAPPIVQIMANPEPANMLSAKFSIPYALASALVGGETGAPAFYDERVGDPAVRSLAERIEISPEPLMNMRRYDYPAARVAITLDDGRTLEGSAAAHYGDSHNPRPREDLLGKFRALAGESLGEERTEEVIAVAGQMDGLGSVRELTRLLGG